MGVDELQGPWDSRAEVLAAVRSSLLPFSGGADPAGTSQQLSTGIRSSV